VMASADLAAYVELCRDGAPRWELDAAWARLSDSERLRIRRWGPVAGVVVEPALVRS
jgi:hypothetical protein